MASRSLTKDRTRMAGGVEKKTRNMRGAEISAKCPTLPPCSPYKDSKARALSGCLRFIS